MKSPFPAVTIGVMTCNYGRFLPEALDSILRQERDDWEVIIADDASTDGTPQIVQPYLRDPRITYVRHPQNRGQAENWRFLLASGTAPVVAVLHADDCWLPGTLRAALEAFDAAPDLDLFYGNWYRRVEGEIAPLPAKREAPHCWPGASEYRYQVSRFTWLPSAVFLSRRVICRAGWPNPTLTMMVDAEYFLRIALHSRRVQAVAAPLMIYRVHARSVTAEAAANGHFHAEMEQMPALCAAMLEEFPALNPCRAALRRHMARSLFSAGVSDAVRGRQKAGRALMRRGMRLHPAILISALVWADYLLACSGPPALPILRRLHRRRLPAHTTPQELTQ